MSNIFSKPTGIPYFDSLKSPAFKSVATVVERVQKHMGTRYIQSSFHKDMFALGYARPNQKEMDRFLAACEAGLVELVTRGSSEEQSEEAEEHARDQVVEEAINDAASSVLPVTPEAATQAEFARTIEAVVSSRTPFEILTESLMADAMAELQRDLESQARILVASRLRLMVEIYERGEIPV